MSALIGLIKARKNRLITAILRLAVTVAAAVVAIPLTIYAVTFSAGLALTGMIPVFAVYSTFLQRGYDQLIHDVAMQNAHVILGIDRAGVVGEDGETHQGLFDVSMLNSIPGATVFSPCYYDGLKSSLSCAIYDSEGLVAVRYPRGSEGDRPSDYGAENVDFDIYGDPDSDTLLVTYGRLFCEAVKAQKLLKEQGRNICIMKLCRIKPIDITAVGIARGFKNIYFFEEGMRSGSVADMLRDKLDDMGFGGSYHVKAVDNAFVQHASVESSLKKLGLDAESMAEAMR